jgi:predicted transcriptional regulator
MPPVIDRSGITGDLQTQIMAVLWRLGSGTVEEVRTALPTRYRSAYNTVQTVLTRLHERRLLDRDRQGRGYVYRPAVTEAEYLSQTIGRTLSNASTQARQAVLAELLGGLDAEELDELQQLAKEAGAQRRRSS